MLTITKYAKVFPDKIKLFALAFLFVLINQTTGQQLQPGFDKSEFKELLLISARTSANASYYKNFEEPKSFKMVYQSPVVGLDNMWDLWTNETGIAVISIRGTTSNSASWLANFYAAMVPAKGQLHINDSTLFNYDLAPDPKAAVHVGWLLCTAYLSADIVPKIKELNKKGINNFIIMGHSQGGAIAYLLTAYLYNLQKQKVLASTIQFKTYCSAAPKPGNLYFAYDYETLTKNGWAYNVVNAADWVPETPVSTQTTNDFNATNPFEQAKAAFKKNKFPKNIVLKHLYNKLDKPSKKAEHNYEKYLGEVLSKTIKKNLPGYQPPAYYHSTYYVRTGTTIVLMPDSDYFKKYPNQSDSVFTHHYHDAYLYLLTKY